METGCKGGYWDLKVLFLTNIPSPYRVDFFNELGKFCDLTVLFEKNSSSERDSSWKDQSIIFFKGIILKGLPFSTDKAICPGIIKYLKKGKFDFIIVANSLTPTGMLAIQYMRWNNISFIIEGDGGFPGSGQGFKEMLKRHFIKGAKAYFSTSDMHDAYYLAYGASKERIYRYPFTSLRSHDLLDKPLNTVEKFSIKRELGIDEEKVVLSVGRFIHGKGYDVLLKACNRLDNNVGIYLIGGQPTSEYLKMKEEHHLINVHFLDFLLKDQLKKYYLCADLFVLPTREDIWGLVINEAMAFGLPVITTDKCIAGLELIENEVNGYIIPTEDEKALLEKIKIILRDNSLHEKMSKNNLMKISQYTIEKMVKRHLDIIAVK